MKKQLALLMICLFAAGKIVAEVEPNDSYTQSNTLAIGGTESGSMYMTDIDWYQVTLPEDGDLIIMFSASGVEAIRLYDFNGSTILNTVVSGGTFTLTSNGLAAGTYYIRMVNYYFTPSSTYSLSSVFTPTGLLNDSEPNGTTSTAVPLTLSSSTTGHIGYYYNLNDDTNDFYSVSLPSLGNFSFTFSSANAQTVYATLYASDGTTVILSDFTNGTKTLTANNLASGTYYLKINNSITSEYAPYTLTNVFTPLLSNCIQPATATICNGGSVTLNALCNLGNSCNALPGNFIPNLVAYYPFCGNANDAFSTNNPSFTNATLTTDRFGNTNSAYSFNGTSQYIKGSCNNFPTASRTVSLWFNLNNPADHQGVFAYGGGSCGTTFFITFNQTNHAGTYTTQGHCEIGNFSSSVGYPPSAGWSNLIVTSGSGVTKFYINGVLTNTSNVDYFGTNVSGKDFAIGCVTSPQGVAPYTDTNMGFFNGSLDDIMIYNTVYNSTQVQQLYQYLALPSYLWSTGATTSSITVSPTQTTTYSLTITDYNGTGVSNSTVTVNSGGINQNTLSGKFQLCPGETTTLTATNGNGYLWIPGNQTTQSITVNTPGIYRVNITDTNGCTSQSAPAKVIAVANPAASVTAIGLPQICLNDTAQLIASPDSVFGNAIELDGFDDFVSIANPGSLGNTITYEAWVYPFDGQSAQGIILRGDSTNHGINFGIQNHQLWVGGNNGLASWSNSYIGSVPDSVWTHVAAAYNQASGNIDVYINGVLAGTTTRTFLINDISFVAKIGRNQTVSGQFFKGKIDEVRIWNTTLSQSTLQTWMSKNINASHPDYSSLKALYNLDSNGGLTALDASSNNSHGNLNNGAYWVPSSVITIPTTFSWSPTTDMLNANTLSPLVFPSSNTTYQVTITNPSTLCQSSASQLITFKTPSVAPTQINSSNGNFICAGGGTTLTVSGGSLGSNANWKWYAGNCGGSFIATGISIPVTPASNTTYFVRGEGDCNITTCLSITINVSITAPSASVVVPPITGLPVNACNGTTNTLSIPSVAGATQYIWDGPTGTTFNGSGNPYTSSTPTANITFGNPNGSGYYIGVQAANSCGTTVRKVQWVRSTVSVPASITGLTVACPNSAGNYSTGVTTGATSYLWTVTGDATVIGTGTTASVNFGPLFTSGVLCVSAQTSCYTSAPKCITISKSAAVVPMITGILSACIGQTVQYCVAPQPGVSFYAWTLPPNTSGSSTSNCINVTFNAGYIGGNISVVSTNICGVTSTPRTTTLKWGVPTTPAFITGPATGLCGQTIVYSCPAQTGVTFAWAVPAGTINSGQGSNAISVTMGTFTTSTVCVTASNACGASVARCITVSGAPGTPGAITAIPSSWCSNATGIQFDVNVASLTGSYTLSWLYPGPAVATYVLGGGNSTQLILDWITGSGPVNVTASNACGNQTRNSTQANSCREGEELISDVHSELIVNPNPTTGNINVEFNSLSKGNASVTVQDISGRIIVSQTINTAEGINKIQLDLTKVSKGIYMLSLNSKDETSKVKIVVQ